jgi:transposase
MPSFRCLPQRAVRELAVIGIARTLMCVRSYQARSTRFPNRGHFASWTGTAPIDVSSGDRKHHRLSRGGNRQINMVLHMMAVVQLRNPTEGRAYYDRKLAAGKSPNEAMRCP